MRSLSWLGSRTGRDEAFHYRYHPLTLRIEEIIASGELGTLERVEAAVCFLLPKFLRHPLLLRAGWWRDDGRRVLCGPHGSNVRRWNSGSRFGAGETARSADRPRDERRVAVSRRLHRPGPHLDAVKSTNGKRVERLPRRASYAYQLDAFAAAVLHGDPVMTTPEDTVENTTVIDAIYRAASLPLREPSRNHDTKFNDADPTAHRVSTRPVLDGIYRPDRVWPSVATGVILLSIDNRVEGAP